MRTICFDLRALQIGHENRGIGMYIKSVLEHLPESDDSYIFYCFDKNDPIKSLNINAKVNYNLVQIPTIDPVLDSPRNIVGIMRLTNHRFTALKKMKPDVFVQFDFMLGLPGFRKTKKIVIGYDLIPLIMRNEYMPGLSFSWHHAFGKKAKLRAVLRSLYYQLRYRMAYSVYRRADKVVAISEASAKSFEELLHIRPSRVVAIPLAPVSVPASHVDLSISVKIKKPYLFYIGGTDARKSLRDIVCAFNIARGRGEDLALVLAGNEFHKTENIPDAMGRQAIMESPYRADIHLVGFVSDAQKLGLYRSAHAFIFASTYEGFGLPVIEAMAALCPVIAYNNSSIPEAAGDAAILVKTGDYGEIAKKIIELKDQDLREKLVKKGLSQAGKFDWNTYTRAFVDTFR